MVGIERTLLLIKPDGLQRALVGEIISRLERKGLKLVGIKMLRLTDEALDRHYAHLLDKELYPQLRDFMKSCPVIASCWEGTDCVETVRKICGITKAREAALGTIRGDLAMSVRANLIHASDSSETARQEIKRFFHLQELFEYQRVLEEFTYSPQELEE